MTASVGSVAVPTFDEFVTAVHGWGPFPWQSEFALRAVRGRWPGALDVPTGMGKTSVLDAFVYALAASEFDAEADAGVGNRAPRRAIFVVDRRVVVDAAYEHAQKLADRLAEAHDGPLKWVADRLSALGHELDRPLEVVRMRGGVTWDWRWLRQPDQPAIVVGTVDQFGSRLLFRGYGVGDKLRSIDAALVGADCVIFLDEAHLSTPLVETVKRCAVIEQRGERRPLSVPTRIVTMTATPMRADVDRLRVGPDDLDHPAASLRLGAVKRACLVEVTEIPKSPKGLPVMGEALAVGAQRLGLEQPGGVILVIANTIKAARAAFGALEGKPGLQAHLVIGRCRDLDREIARNEWWDLAQAGRPDRMARGPKTLVIVATQTVEVGADLDCDALVSEAAPIDALVQRFGRVDRLGELGETTSLIIYGPTLSIDDPVYGGATAKTWEFLRREAGEIVTVKKPKELSSVDVNGPTIDFGPLALRERIDQQGDVSSLVARPPDPPLLLSRMVLDWARTKPAPVPDREVAPFLHGLTSDRPTVDIVWRAGLGSDVKKWTDELERCAPTSAEAVSIPIDEARRFLSGATVGSEAISDLEGGVSDPVSPASGERIDAVAYRGRGEAVPLRSGSDLRAGDLIVVSTAAGGHDRFGWTGQPGDPVADIGDLVGRAFGTRLRVDTELLVGLGLPYADVVAARAALVGAVEDFTEDAVPTFLDDIERLATGRYGPNLRGLVGRLRPFSFIVGDRPGAKRGAVALTYADPTDASDEISVASVTLLARLPSHHDSRSPRTLPDGMDDETGSSFSGAEVPLSQHLGAVAARAEAFARHVGFRVDLVDSLRVAGAAHDLGKADIRFQATLRRIDRAFAEAYDEPELHLAKSHDGTRSWRDHVAVSKAAGWPIGMRHEAVSLALLRSDPTIAEAFPTLDWELVEHLVASHHGHARPLFPPILDAEPTKVRARFVEQGLGAGRVLEAMSDETIMDWTQPARLEMLCRRYGPWGLALLEATLRLADIAVSEEGS